jgi:hypothetical protein
MCEALENPLTDLQIIAAAMRVSIGVVSVQRFNTWTPCRFYGNSPSTADHPPSGANDAVRREGVTMSEIATRH